jgi:hypothetical protein
MAATGFTPIQLYRTTTASAQPSAGNLADGELAINLTDKKLYAKDASNNVFVLADASSGGTTATNLAGGAAGSVPYQTGANATTFLGIGTAAQVLQVNSGATAPEWVNTSGTGDVARTTSPSFTTPSLGAATALSINSLTLTTSTGTFTLANGKTLTVNNSLTLSGTDATTMTFPSTSATIARTDAAQSFTGTQTFLSNPVLDAGTANGVLYLNGSKVVTSGSALTFDGANLSSTGGATFQGGPTGYGGGEVRLGTTASGQQSAISTLSVDSPVLVFDHRGTSNTGVFVWRNGTNGANELARLTSTGLAIGTSSPLTRLNPQADSTNPDLGQLVISGATNANKRLSLGFQTTGNYGFVQSLIAGDNYYPLVLQPNGGNVGIGTSNPGAKLDIVGATSNQIRVGTATSEHYRIGRNASDGFLDFYGSQTGYQGYRFGGIDGTWATINTSGNLGLGVTPSAWAKQFTFSLADRVESALTTGWSALAGYAAADTALFSNAYFDGGYKYIGNGFASQYRQINSAHQWFTAPSGTAGDPISFTQAMTLDASGNLLVGGTSALGSAASRGNITVNGATDAILSFGNAASLAGYILQDSGGMTLFSSGATYQRFYTNNTERARITSGGNFKIGGSADRATTEGDKQLVLFDGTAPVGTLANGVSFYSASGEANVMDAAGNATLLSPHDAETNEWIFRSKHTPTGKVLKIDVERLLKFVNDHFGLDAVHEFIEA